MTLLVENLKKSFGDTKVFENVSFSIEKCQIVCIKGKSGEGKTTLLRCLTTLETPDGGSIKINDKYLYKEVGGRMETASKDKLQIIRQEIGLVFQSYNLFPHMTVKENLILAANYLKKQSKKDIEKRADELLNQLGLDGKGDSYPYQLSGGQQQRVAIARACMLNPSVLCFDEPTSALDEETRGQISEIIRSLAAQGIAIIIVTHDNAFVDEIAERVITLSEGSIYEGVRLE